MRAVGADRVFGSQGHCRIAYLSAGLPTCCGFAPGLAADAPAGHAPSAVSCPPCRSRSALMAPSPRTAPPARPPSERQDCERHISSSTILRPSSRIRSRCGSSTQGRRPPVRDPRGRAGHVLLPPAAVGTRPADHRGRPRCQRARQATTPGSRVSCPCLAGRWRPNGAPVVQEPGTTRRAGCRVAS